MRMFKKTSKKKNPNPNQHTFYFADSMLAVAETASESCGTRAAHQDTSMVSPSNTV